MDSLKFMVTEFISFLASLIVTNAKPSLLYRIKTAPSATDLLAVQSRNIDDIVPNNIVLAHLRIQASTFLLAQLLPVILRLEYYLKGHRRRSESLREHPLILRIPSLADAEQFDALGDTVQSLLNCFYSFVGLHVQATDAIRMSLMSRRSDDLAPSIVASCRQASALCDAVQNSSSVQELHYSVTGVIHEFSALREASNPEHIAGQLGQFWNQNSAGKRFGDRDVHVTLRMIQRELISLKQLRKDLIELISNELSPRQGFMRHPVRYAGLTCIVALGSRVVATHARYFGGTGKLEDAVVDKIEALKFFADTNIVEPAVQLYEQVFVASPVAANEESVAASKSAVQDLLIDFTRKYLPDTPEALELAENGSMKAMFDVIRRQAGTPVRSLLQGSLAQAMLIQIQKLKCDVEELMVKTKQTLRAQELNLALVALVPSLLSGVLFAYLVSTVSFHWRNRGREMIVSGGQTAKFLLADIQRSLLSLEGYTEKECNYDNSSFTLTYYQHLGIIRVKIMELNHLIGRGVVSAPPAVLGRLQKDITFLQDPASTFKKKGQDIERILSCYSFLSKM